MLRHKPTFTYNGLTIILSNPSRFDTIKLLSAGGGRLFDEACKPDFNRFQCDIRLLEDSSPLLPGTKCILLSGSDAPKRLLPSTRENTIGEIRGSVYSFQDIPTIPTFFFQDAADFKNYEKEFNPETTSEDDKDTTEESGSIAEKRRHGRTQRKNYPFWIKKDIEKCKVILQNNGIVPARPIEPNYVIYPSSDTIIKELTTTKNADFFFDMETDEEWNMQCFAFSFSKQSNIFVCPCFNHNYTHSYGNLHHIFRALAIAIRDNKTIAHNGANFDFLVLAERYHIPIGKNVADTLIQEHRIFAMPEKSLGHCTSLWTFEPFHKDEGSSGYSNIEQCRAKWQYCGKDVFTMKLIYYAQLDYAKRRVGLIDSINQAISSIRPFLLTTLLGISYDENERLSIVKENDRLCAQYLRMLSILIGEDNLKSIRGSGKSSMPNSNKQCVEYFHNRLGYEIVGRGKPSTKTGERHPSLAKKNLYKLKLNHDNPVIDICIAYRETIKESGSLAFNPWRI